MRRALERRRAPKEALTSAPERSYLRFPQGYFPAGASPTLSSPRPLSIHLEFPPHPHYLETQTPFSIYWLIKVHEPIKLLSSRGFPPKPANVFGRYPKKSMPLDGTSEKMPACWENTPASFPKTIPHLSRGGIQPPKKTRVLPQLGDIERAPIERKAAW